MRSQSPSLDVQTAPGGGTRITVDIPVPAPALVVRPAADATKTSYERSPDCMIVDLPDGYRHLFTRKQRRVVAMLFQARDDGYDFVDQQALLNAAESDQQQLRFLFRDHAAWGTLILNGLECGGPAGAYRIAP